MDRDARVPVEKFSMERTVFFSRATEVPPEVTKSTFLVFRFERKSRTLEIFEEIDFFSGSVSSFSIENGARIDSSISS